MNSFARRYFGLTLLDEMSAEVSPASDEDLLHHGFGMESRRIHQHAPGRPGAPGSASSRVPRGGNGMRLTVQGPPGMPATFTGRQKSQAEGVETRCLAFGAVGMTGFEPATP